MTTTTHTTTPATDSVATITARLEHINLTVSDPERTAAMLVDLFGWHVRWEGASIHDGRTIHVGTDDDYLALYTMPAAEGSDPIATNSYGLTGGLNHVALVVSDLDEAERRVEAAGYVPTNHADYEPGRRFYFRDHDGIEFEIVSYD